MPHRLGRLLRPGRHALLAAAAAAALVVGPLALAAPATATTATATASATALARPNFQTPLACGETWNANTRTNHNPQNSVDFQRSGALGRATLASASGTVTTVRDLGGTSYGRYIVIDHGDGWTSLYAHLASFNVSVGQRVTVGQRIGSVGSTGGSTGPHLHYEQRSGGSAVRVIVNGLAIRYFGNTTVTSSNGCGGGGEATGTVRTAGPALTVRAQPTTASAAVGSRANGSTVTIQCQVRGQSVTGTYGTSDLWDYIGSGYIADAYVYTGSDGQVAPTC
ncbi:M23 family metallopeptidase [Allonocardiopsis opalescens]|uniref:Peptidase M23-like protein n=1 Tax=Allonocardiopsis opalescens TaxID=1144618 RepID=A0A2T0Q0Y3_9ACTN|nr:M23 family metallopeptidase [Allonocardiopsis opalescens]PRX97375.1 peptidase M23-like protein [Allonocardiopsis opalescens]